MSSFPNSPTPLDSSEDEEEAPRPIRRRGIWDGVDRRSGDDRRERPTGMLDSLFGRKRRRTGRRTGDSDNSYVDVYRRRDVLMLLCVFVFNVFDALFTLIWLQKGGAEGNPVMDLFIRAGDGVFLAQKCFVVGIWLIILTVHKNFRFARIGMWMLLCLYGGVLIYHFYLQLSGVSPIIAE